jgi:hypothetical protein
MNMDQRMMAKKLADLEKKLQTIDKVVQNIVGAVNQGLGQASTQLENVVEVLDAVVKVVGPESIQSVMTAAREAKMEEQIQSEEEALNKLLESGDLMPIDKIAEQSIVVGREFKVDGSLRTRRAQVPYSRIEPQFQPSFLGQGVGFVLELPNGGKFEVMGIYAIVDKTQALPTANSPVTPESA